MQDKFMRNKKNSCQFFFLKLISTRIFNNLKKEFSENLTFFFTAYFEL